MDSLSGHFLIATPHMPDPRFRGQVIYLCAHNETGIMGLVVNNPSPEITLHDILLGANLPITEGPAAPVYLGGPVEPEAGFLLFTAEVPSRFAMQIQPGVFVSRDSRILDDIAKGEGPDEFLFLLGYAGWGPGQLERELQDNSWLVAQGDADLIFRTPASQRWKRAAGFVGIDMSQLGDIVGNA